MKQLQRINDLLVIEKVRTAHQTAISLYIGNEKMLLAMAKTNDYTILEYVYDENYIVIYYRGCMVNQIPLGVKVVYDIKNNNLVNICNSNKILFEYMYISKKGFYVPVVLEYISGQNLQLATKDELDDFVRYITAGNNQITREMIVAYVLKNYPFLEKYKAINPPLTILKYREIMEEIEIAILRFHIMPQTLRKK